MPRLAIALCLLALSGGCVLNVGARAERLEVATAPGGTVADVRLRAGDETLAGELLEVRDAALVILSAGRVTVVPLGAIQRVTFLDSPVYLNGGDSFTTPELNELRLISRYPQGISAGVMTALLAAHGQSEPRLIAR